MTDHDKFDPLLDRALSEYGNVSPREGLEQRLLARLAAEQPRRSWNWRWLWAAVPAMAIGLIVFLATRPAVKPDTNVAKAPSRPIITPATPKAAGLSPTQAPQVSAVHAPRRVHTDATVSTMESSGAQPKLTTFPSPDESEQQARLLLAFVTHHPEEAHEVVEDNQQFYEMAEARMNQQSERLEHQR